MDLSEIRRRLAKTPGLSRLSGAARNALVGRGEVRKIARGETLFREGETGRTAYVVLGGAFTLFREVEDEQALPIALRTAGEWLGEMALLDGGPRSATAVAEAAAEVLEVPRAAFARLVNEEPAVALAIAAAIGQRLREADGALVQSLRKRNDELLAEVARLRTTRHADAEPAHDDRFFPGPSSGAVRVRRAVRQAAANDLPVLVHGEPGSGRATVARAIHAGGSRARKPFVDVDCSLLSAPAVEVELFGRASDARPSAIDRADGGTLYLRAVDAAPTWLQGVVATWLATGEVRRVGETGPRRSRARVILGAAQDVDALVKAGRLRDEFLALPLQQIAVPPLRARRADLPLLVDAFLGALASDGGPRLRFDAGALRALARYPFPENLRELRSVLDGLRREHGAAELGAHDVARALPASEPQWPRTYAEATREFSRHHIAAALAEAHGNQAAAARALGVHPSNLIRMMRRLKLDRP